LLGTVNVELVSVIFLVTGLYKALLLQFNICFSV